MPADLPTHQIDKSFLQEILKEPVQDFIVSWGSNPGDNVQSQLLAVKVRTASGQTLNLIHKSLHSKSPWTLGFFKNEVAFYLQVLPILQRISTQPSIPKFYNGLSDGETDYLCMEDVRPEGYIMLDKFSGLPFAETALALTEIAKFHASTYNVVRHEGERIFTSILSEDTFRYSWLKPEGITSGQEWYPGFYQTGIDVLANRNAGLAAAMKSVPKEDVFQIATRVARKTDTNYFPLIIHGDLWLNNILFKYNEAGEPVSLKFVDFQLARRGNLFEDLLYFIYTSTTPAVRKPHLLQLLTTYYESFQESLETLGCPLPIGFTKGYFIDSFYKELLSPFVYLTFAIPLQLNQVPELMDFEKYRKKEESGVMKEKSDGDSQQFVNQLRFYMENSPKAIERLEAVTKEMVELNVLPI